ncbi:MAG: radical SAM protein [Actinobacteria bacterium]|nr:radical SAM protein [Actinomycetota bacterium]
MIIKEIYSKSILSPSKVYPYVINPYIGCQHGCFYCYARFMKKYTGHKETWGEFVDIKVNTPELLKKEIKKKKLGKVWISGVCDPYQPVEERYKLTYKCIEILVQNNWPVVIQTKSPLVLRDINIFKIGKNFEVGLSIGTADDIIRKLFEPNAPSIDDRVWALDELHKAGVRTYAMIAPMLPGAEGLGRMLKGKVDYVIFDRMNYNYANWVYKKYNLEDKMTDSFFYETTRALRKVLS